MFDYFFNDVFLMDDERYNKVVKGLRTFAKPVVGDVLKVFFSKKGSYFFFEGFVFSLKRKYFLKPDSGFKLINQLKNIKIVFSFSYFYNLMFSIEHLDHKKSKKIYRASKISFSVI